MCLLRIYLILVLKATDSRITEKRSYYVPQQSAATAAQIRFAEENKYDDTGPGAKEPQAAYKTFKTLEDALIAYLDDPDTKLPESEMIKAYKKLLSQKDYKSYPKHQTQAIFLTKYQNNHPNKYYTSKIASVFPAIESKYSSPLRRAGDLELEVKDRPRPFKLEKVKDASPVYADEEKPEDDPDPEYTYSYGVHVSIDGYFSVNLSSTNLDLVRIQRIAMIKVCVGRSSPILE
ncbi:hypothetical protein EVAR_35759_1 [Eumeta japonica]|uniref:Uncharacterized protein n=1 Tax=Eumeta variegata TaxID=151549 RepID=A0A4C1WNY5_EUMVA|nr:hypothetical protein EVAR_35759_1 [Eumeta japonica]